MAKPFENIVTLDAETYFSDDYTLKKITTTMYVRDPRFKVHGLGLKINDLHTEWLYSPEDIRRRLQGIDWSRTACLAHNAAFDGFILSQHYGIRPGYFLDTMSMARVLLTHDISTSLNSVAEFLGLGQKIPDILDKTKGVRDLDPEVLAQLGKYCVQDVELTYKIYQRLKDELPESEYDLIDITIKMFTDPVLEVDHDLVYEAIEDAREARENTIKQVLGIIDAHNISDAGVILRSNDKFAQEVKKHAPVPYKISKQTGKRTYAFSKTDLGFLRLRKKSPELSKMVDARIAAKSNIEESRAIRLLEHSDGHRLPIMLNYGKAHTYRWTGGDKINPQNFGRGSKLRRSLRAPKGFRLVVVDSSQIEARCCAWLASQMDLLDEFRISDSGSGIDPYCGMASQIYGRNITPDDKMERFVGKVCFAHDTQILTRRGWVPIIDVSLNDQVWDGVEWVNHAGVITVGEKEVITTYGITGTPDHEILTEHGWRKLEEVHTNNILFQSALNMASLPWFVTNIIRLQKVSYGVTDLCVNVLAALKQWYIQQTSSGGELHDAINVQKLKPAPNVTGNTNQQCSTTNTAQGCLIDCLQLSPVAITQETNITSIMANVALRFVNYGKTIGQNFCNMFRHWKAGIYRNTIWIESTQIKDINQGILDSFPEATMQKINEKSKTLKQKSVVYELCSAGPRTRYTILTSQGPIIAHNCILGLGYKMGAERFKETLAQGAMGPPMQITLEEASRAVQLYRNKNAMIVNLWDFMKKAIGFMITGHEFSYKCLAFRREEVVLPNGLSLWYPHLGYHNYECMYASGHGKRSRLYDGLLTENVVQALARIVVAEQMRTISKEYRIVTTTHDEVVYLAEEENADKALQRGIQVFRTPPSWCADLPLNAEGAHDECYSK